MRARSVLTVIAVLLVPAFAHAEVDCPPGSTRKSEGADVWCQPSVCATDAQCGPGELCKPVPLCVEFGQQKKTAALADAGPIFMARQKCGLDKQCPSSTTCLEGSRCITKADAEKMGLLGAAPPASTSSDATSGKKACGCSTPGAPAAGTGALVGLALALGAAARRRARSAHR